MTTEQTARKDQGPPARAKPDDTPATRRTAAPPLTETAVEPEREDRPETKRKVTPPTDSNAVTYGCSSEWVSLQEIVDGFDSAVARFRCGLDHGGDDGDAVIEEVFNYLVQLSYTLEDVWQREPNVNLPQDLWSRILTQTQEVDGQLNKEMGFHAGWSVDVFVEMAVTMILMLIETAKIDVNDHVREWRLATLKKTDRSGIAFQALCVKTLKTLGRALGGAVDEPAKASKGKASRKHK